MSAKLLLASLSLIGAALSQSTSVTSIFFLEDSESLVASVIAAGPTATTFQVECASNVPVFRCAFPTAATVTAGASSVHYGWTHTNMMLDEQCMLTSSSTATCTATASTSGHDAQTSTATLSGADVTRRYLPVTITAGLEKISAASTVATVTTGTAASTLVTHAAAAADQTGAAMDNVVRGASVAGLAGVVAAFFAL